MKTYKILDVNYDVAGGDQEFEKIVFEGERFVGVQFFYTSLNQVDHKLRLRESFDGVNFLDALDSSGATIEITIDNALTTDILKSYDFNSGFIKFEFVVGTAGTGTIDKLKIIME